MSVHVSRLWIFATIAIAVSIAACGSDTAADRDPFATYQACFTEHAVTESFPAPKAITICCLDHAIGAAAAGVVCGATAATCETYVGANLMGSDASGAEITAGCTDYIAEKGR
jgi:hypothetical protein